MNKKQSSGSASQVIKNPVRSGSSKRHVEPYQSEHIRLGLEPPPPLQVSPEEFIYSKRNKKAAPSSTESDSEISKHQRMSYFWSPCEDDDLQQVEEYAHADIDYDEVTDHNEVTDPISQDTSDDDLLLQIQNISPHQYFAVIDNLIVHSASSISELEEGLESLIFNSNSPYHGYSIDQVAIFQRLELKFGILVK